MNRNIVTTKLRERLQELTDCNDMIAVNIPAVRVNFIPG